MKLKSLSLSDVEQVRLWRNQQLEMLRTPFVLAKEQQEQFYHDVVCNRYANARYWGIWVNESIRNSVNAVSDLYSVCKKDCGTCDDCFYDDILKFIGMCGIENISWENRLAEISIILDTEYSMDKYGEEALKLLFNEGFMNMGLENIYTEVYGCSRHFNFWFDINTKYNKNRLIELPNRKYWMGKYWSSYYININKGAYINENTIIESTHTLD